MNPLKLNPLKYVIATAAILAFAGFSSASASVVYDGGAPDQLGQIYAELPDSVAMSFTISAGTTITGANWWGGCFDPTTGGGSCSGSEFELTIWSNSSTGGPDSVVDFMPVGGAVNETATGNTIDATDGGWPEYSYSATFSLATALTPGTLYWFVIQETATEPDGTWGDETTSSAPPGEQMYWYDGGWGPLPEQLAFQLTGTESATPLPASLPFFATGLGVLALFGWCRKRKVQAVAA